MTAITIRRTVNGSPLPFTIEAADEKLRWRAALPGASTWDRVAHTLRTLQGDGASAVELVPLALPASWLVNSRASSRTMHRWLSRPSVEAWSVVLDALRIETGPEDWLTLAAAKRRAVADAIAALVDGAPEGPPLPLDDGSTLAAVSKVLALLRPQLVPLMDDAAVAFALELVPVPTTADRPLAPASAFVPMLDWFARQVVACEPALSAVASRHEPALLDPAQVLDRLVWMESWGHRVARRMWRD